MNKMMNKKYSFIELFCYTLKISFSKYPIHFLVFLSLDFINCVLTFLLTYNTKNFFETVEKSKSYSGDVAGALCVLCIVIIVQHFVNGLGHSVIPALKNKLDRDAMVAVERKLQKVPPIWFEDKTFLDFIDKARKGTDYTFAFLVPMLRFLFQYAPYCVILGVYLSGYDPILAFCVAAIFLPTFLSMVIRPDIFFKFEDDVAPVRRKDEYIKRCVSDPEYFKETRTLGVFQYFMQKFLENTAILNKHIWKTEKKVKIVDSITRLISVCGYGVVMVLLVISLLNGRINTAIYASVLASITLMFLMCEDAAWHFLAPFDGSAIVNNFVSLIKAELPEEASVDIRFKEDIILDDVVFSYPNLERNAIDHVSIEIHKGETIAIVGINGSGKTTLSKLILGLYKPNSGTIKIGNVDVSEAPVHAMSDGMTTVFQKFQKYKMTLADNIIISDIEKIDDNRTMLNKAATEFGITCKDSMFTEGYDTMLGRDFNGVELSGGQWQKLAIARGIYRNRDIIVLDEPTSAIDPLEETNLYNKFSGISEGKTSLIVTHRIGLSKVADRIIVMNQGKIEQIGSFQALMEVDGLFKEMFTSQQKWYEDD